MRRKTISRGKGWRPDLPDARDHLYRESVHFTIESKAKLPPSVDLRSTPNMPPIEDQGQLGSCTAFGTLRCFNFVDRMQGFAPFEPSHLFEYYNARKIEGTVGQDSGATIRDAVKAAVQFGVIPESELPYNIARFTRKPTAKMYADAKRYQVLEYLRVSNSGSAGRQAIQTSLAAGFPVVFGATLYESFEQPGPDPNGMIPMPKPGEQMLGGHCQCIVGYDDAKHAFLVANSWGTSWALKGYEWMPYAYLTNPNLADDFWTLRKVQAPS